MRSELQRSGTSRRSQRGRYPLAVALAGSAMLLFALGGPALAQVTTWFDDFGDGNAEDGSPLSWSPHPALPGDYNATSGDYVFTPYDPSSDDNSMAAAVLSTDFTDVSVRTRMFTAPGLGTGTLGVLARFDFATVSGYFAIISDTGHLQLNRVDPGGVPVDPDLAEVDPVQDPTGNDVTADTDTIIQLDIIGDTLSATAWKPGTPQPAPQAVVTDATYSSGTAGLLFNENDEDVFPLFPSGTFRWTAAASAPIINGDMDYSGAPNGLDVDPFVAAVVSGLYAPPGDVNGDGAVNGLDVEPFVDAVIAGGPVAQSVPEPSALLLVCVGLALCIPFRTRGC